MSEMREKREKQHDSTIETIRKYIHVHFPHAKRQLHTDDDALLDTGVVDSLGILEIVDFLVETFEIEVSDEDLSPENFGSITTLAAFVRRRKEP